MASIRSGIGEFQSTLPREERLFHNCFEHVFNYFNPRSHERSDTMPTPIKLSRSHISIHAPTRGATDTQTYVKVINIISIHAPTRGATPADTAEFHSRLSLFQSTLPREERLLQNTFFTLLILFQSTLPREERPICHSYNQQTIKISIHAPTRGATRLTEHGRYFNSYFNPRSHERSDRSLANTNNSMSDFNPRSHERSDFQFCFGFWFCEISILAPTRGAT